MAPPPCGGETERPACSAVRCGAVDARRRLSAKRRDLRSALDREKGRIARRLLEVSQLGPFSLVPRHFYSQIPDLRELKASYDWRGPRSMIGVRGVSIESQLEFAESCCDQELVELFAQRDVHGDAEVANEAVGYGPIEAGFLYCFVRTVRPPRVVQVGAGVSTSILLDAASDGGFSMDVVCVEPYPTKFLRRAAREGRLTLIEEKAQAVLLDDLTAVPSGGLLFIDSTHAVRPGGEVNRLILEVLPRLSPGSFVHFHDIFFPYDYSPDLLREDVFFWSESAMLQAFLTENPRFEVCVSMSMLHHDVPCELQRILPAYQPANTPSGLFGDPQARGHFPSSLYLRVSGEEEKG